MKHFGCILALILLLPAIVLAEPYEVNYEADVFPEEVGWERYTTGGGATRSVQDGVLTLDTSDSQVSDQYLIDRQGQLDADPAEMFYAEWRMRVVPGSGIVDVSVFLARDAEAGDIDLGFSTDYVTSFFDDHEIFIDTTVFRTYRIESSDMAYYDFYIDGEYQYTGDFDPPGIASSWVLFGDCCVGQASSSQWDYFRFGVVPVARAGDVNADGDIDLNDFATFALCFMGSEVFQPPPDCSGQQFTVSDLDHDGDVDLADFSTFALVFGT